MTELVGLVVDVVHFDVERGKIAEFARSTRAEDSAHVDRRAAESAGFADVLATPTHVVVSGHHRDQKAFVATLGLAIERIVVGSVSWTYERPLLAGDSMTGTRTVVKDEVREGKAGTMRLVTMETSFTDASGVVAVRQQEVLIERPTA